jgi:hypothetical protein
MNPILVPGWWRKPEILISIIAVALQTAITQPGLLKQGTPGFTIAAYIVAVLGALGLGASMATAKKALDAPSPTQEKVHAELKQENETLRGEARGLVAVAYDEKVPH